MSTITAEPDAILDYATPPQQRVSIARICSTIWARMIIIALLLGASYAAFEAGIWCRQRAWGETWERRYTNDVANGFGWGQQALNRHLTYVYDDYTMGRISGPNGLDYTPLRLTVVTLWAKWARAKLNISSGWRNDYELTRPMLELNATAELLSSVLVFLLVRMWIIRMDDARRARLGLIDPPPPFRGVIRGMVGAMFFWFNPAVIWDGHAFPQWDVWNAPFYLAAALLACVDCWFGAGACIVIGAFFKGQILLVAPLFLIWPIVQLRFGAAIRFASGFVFTGALLALPWYNSTIYPIIWGGTFCLGMALISPIVLRMRVRWWYAILLVLAIALAFPWKTAPGASPALRTLPLSFIAGLSLLRFAPSRMIPSVLALAVGLVIFLMMPLYNLSDAWLTQGFEYGTRKMMWMATQGTYSFPQYLVTFFRWANNPQVRVDLPFEIPLIGSWMYFRNLMLLLYGICLIISGVGAGFQSRRNDTRFLVALVAPWLCWFCLLTQLNNRYLIWAAGFSGLLVGVSWGMMLVGAVVSFIGWLAIEDILHWDGGDLRTTRMLNFINPGMIWPLMFLAVIYLYFSIAPRQIDSAR